MPEYVQDPDNPDKHIDVIELQRRNPYKTLPPVLIKDWLKHSQWTWQQAIQLLAGYIPDNHLSLSNPKRYLDKTRDVWLSPMFHPRSSENMADLSTLIDWMDEDKGARKEQSPQDWLAWAKEIEFTPYWLEYVEANQRAPAPNVEAVTVTINATTDKRGTNKKTWDDLKLRALWEESIMPNVTQASLAQKHGITRQRIAALIKSAKEKFSTTRNSSGVKSKRPADPPVKSA